MLSALLFITRILRYLRVRACVSICLASQVFMAPRGLKQLVNSTSPGRLVKGKFTGFKAVGADGNVHGAMLRGITKLLSKKLYSSGELPDEALKSTEFRGGAWNGRNGGLKRGKAVDSQVSRLASAAAGKRRSSSKYKMTHLAFGALEVAGLEPIAGQRVVVDSQHGIATACDVVCYRKKDNSLVVVELKTGYAGNRKLPALTKRSAVCYLSSPCSTAADCVLHRHLAQLSVTRYLLAREHGFMKTLKAKFSIESINGLLLYVCDRDTETYDLDSWWIRRSKRIVSTISA